MTPPAAGTINGTNSANLIGVNPLLGPLANNGGPTLGALGTTLVLQTEALLSGSKAIGKGVLAGAPAKDERGLPSVVNGKVNIGTVSNRP